MAERRSRFLVFTPMLIAVSVAVSLVYAQVETVPPSEAIAREYIAARATQESKGTLKLVGFRKTDGITRVVSGASVYQLEFVADVQVLRDLKWSKQPFQRDFSGFSTTITDAQAQGEGGVWGGFFNASQNVGVEFKRGKLVHLSGVLAFERSERGWRIADGPEIWEAEDTAVPKADEVNPTPSTSTGREVRPSPSSVSGFAQVSGAGLTNADVIKMVQAKLPDSVIVTKIKSSTCNFDTSADALIKLKQVGVSDSVLQGLVEAAGQSSQAVAAPPASQPIGLSAAPACADYASCLASANDARASRQYEQSLIDLQKATTLDPSKPDAWVQMGSLWLASGQPSQAPSVWDKALNLGGTVEFGVWYYAGLHGYQTGMFRLSTKQLSFVPGGRSAAFAIAPNEALSAKSHHPPLEKNAWSFGMKIGGHQYWFAFTPLGVDCQTPNNCGDNAGYGQEQVVATYVAQTIDRLASRGTGD